MHEYIYIEKNILMNFISVRNDKTNKYGIFTN